MGLIGQYLLFNICVYIYTFGEGILHQFISAGFSGVVFSRDMPVCMVKGHLQSMQS